MLGPWPVVANRVTRFYRGGALLDAFREGTLGEGVLGQAGATARDTDRPEDWVASATSAWLPPDRDPSEEGLGSVVVDGANRRVRDLLARDPEGVGGPIVARAGTTTGLLVKLLDAAIRLPVHAHPTRAFARRHLGSWFGKAEAWIVLGTREVPGEPAASIRLGFRRDVGRDELGDLITGRRSADLLELLNERSIAPGDAWFVPPGTPHAIGAGALILELQEPTDFSIVAETAGFPINPEDAHLRKGWGTMLDAFDRGGLGERALEGLRGTAPGPSGTTTAELDRRRLIPSAADPYLRAERWLVHGEARPDEAPAFLVGVVTAGNGRVRVDGGADLAVRPGATFAVPAAGLPRLVLEGDGLTVVACLPPRLEDLGRDGPEVAP